MVEDLYPGVHGAALKDLARRFGGYLRSRFTVVATTVVGDVITLAQANADRVYIAFYNVGGGNVTIGISPQMTLSGGLIVAPMTDRAFNLIDHAVLPTEHWTMTGAAGNGLGVLEVVRESAYLPRG